MFPSLFAQMSILNIFNFSEDIGTKYSIEILLIKIKRMRLKMKTGEVFADRVENTLLNRWIKK